MSSSIPTDVKNAQRRGALARRDAIPAATREAAAAALARRAFPVQVAPRTVVSGYSPIRSELDPRPLMLRLAADGAELALPVVTGPAQPLVFRKWVPGETLQSAAFGLSEPTEEAEPLVPDIVLVPLAAFDRAGHRLGYGAGHYDRTLALLRARRPVVAIGLAFAAQETENIAAGPYDQPLDMVITEGGIVDFRGG